jgi:hypothetical protein
MPDNYQFGENRYQPNVINT